MNTKRTFDYVQTRAILSRRVNIESTLEDLVHYQVAETKSELTKRLNKALYDMAEEHGVSLYDVCFNHVPDYEFNLEENRAVMKVTMKPINLTYESDYKWIKVSDRLPENDATSVLRCDGPIEGGCELYLGYYDGEAFYTKDGLRVYPTHYMKIVLPNEGD